MKKIISQNEEIKAFIDKEFGIDEDNIKSDYGSKIEVFQEGNYEKNVLREKIRQREEEKKITIKKKTKKRSKKND